MKLISVMVPICAVFLLMVAYAMSAWVTRAPKGSERMENTVWAVRATVSTFRKSEFRMLIPVLLLLFLLQGFLLDWKTAVLFLAGAIFAGLAATLAINAATKGNGRAACYAKEGGMSRAQRISFRSGAIFGLCAIGFALLATGLVFAFLGIKTAAIISGFGFGGCIVVIFERVGGGYFMKSLPEFVRKGAAIGDVAGMTADILSSYAASIVAVVVLSSTAIQIIPSFGSAFILDPMAGALYPLTVLSIGAIGSAFAVLIVRGKGGVNPAATLNLGIVINLVAVLIGSAVLSWIFFEGFNCFLTIAMGLFYSLAVAYLAGLAASQNGKHIRRIAEMTGKNTSSFLLMVFGTGLFTTLWPILLLIFLLFASKAVAGVYGIALASVGALSAAGMMLAAEGFGQITGSVGWITRIVGLSGDVKTITDNLEASGRKVVASGKGYSMSAVVLTEIALFFAFCMITAQSAVTLLSARVLIGLFAGGCIPFLLSALMLEQLSKKEEKQRLEKEPQTEAERFEILWMGLEEQKKEQKLVAKASVKETIVPALIAVISPVATGLLFGTASVAGFLIGMLLSGILLCASTANAGVLFRTVRLYIENDHYGGRGSASHGAALIGDGIGDSLKDVVAPSLDAFLRMMSIEAVLFAPLFLLVGGLF